MTITNLQKIKVSIFNDTFIDHRVDIFVLIIDIVMSYVFIIYKLNILFLFVSLSQILPETSRRKR